MLEEEAMAGMGVHARVREAFDAAPGSLVIDAGTGLGTFTAWLLSLGYRVVALGIDPKQYGASAPFVWCNLDQGLPFRSESADAIVAIEVLEHLENPMAFFREASRCLTMFGTLIITTPNVLSISSKVSLIFRNHPLYFSDRDYYENGHISPISRHQISRIAQRTGFGIEVVRYSVGKLPVPRLRHRLPLRHKFFEREFWGENLVIRLRKLGPPELQINRG
jgi:2-polyprenyl-3-methyl-5-hydroxy-6-metoxy-1,4-benzoquinol methylase